MRRAKSTGLVAVLVLAVTTGCTDSAEPHVAPATSLSTGSPTTTQVAQSPQLLLDAALGKVRQAEAVSFKSRTVSSVNDRVSMFDTSGVWDSRQPSWETTTIAKVPQDVLRTYTTKQRYVDSRLYRSFSVNDAASIGWSDQTHGNDPYSAPTPKWQRPGPFPTDIKVLLLIEPTAVNSVGRNSVLTGTLPNRVGLEMLSLTGHLSEIGLVMYDQGQTTVHLTLDSTEFPIRLDILGSDADLVSPQIPDYVKDELGASSYRADYTKTQDVPPIKAPAHTVRLTN